MDGTGLIYMRARYYDPEVGRFITADPMSGAPDNPQSLNPYVYVRNNPVNLTDPSGYGPGYNGRIESFADGFKALAIMTATMVGLPALVQGAGYVAPIAFASAPVVQKVVPRVAPAAQRAVPVVEKAAHKCDDIFPKWRPYLQKAVKEAILKAAPKTPDGKYYLDAYTKQPITGKFQIGHKYGQEFWRLREHAMANNETWEAFRKSLQNPKLYQVEDALLNMSHGREMPR